MILEAVSLNKQFLPQFPDLVLDNNRKLKGGAKEETIKRFISKTDQYNTVLNVLRSSKLFEQFNNHEKCRVADLCSFCLLRSLMFKINNPKGRKKIIPVEIEIQFQSTDDQQPISCKLADILRKASSCNQEFKKSICIMNCNPRDACELPCKKELKTCIFNCNSINVDLHENVTYGDNMWRCVGAVSIDGMAYFRHGNKWYQSNECIEMGITELKDINLAVYDKVTLLDFDMSDESVYQGEELKNYVINFKKEKKIDI